MGLDVSEPIAAEFSWDEHDLGVRIDISLDSTLALQNQVARLFFGPDIFVCRLIFSTYAACFEMTYPARLGALGIWESKSEDLGALKVKKNGGVNNLGDVSVAKSVMWIHCWYRAVLSVREFVFKAVTLSAWLVLWGFFCYFHSAEVYCLVGCVFDSVCFGSTSCVAVVLALRDEAVAQLCGGRGFMSETWRLLFADQCGAIMLMCPIRFYGVHCFCSNFVNFNFWA